MLFVGLRADARPPGIAGCHVDARDPNVAVVDAIVVATHQPSYRCGNGSGFTAHNVDEAMALLDSASSHAGSDAAVERPTVSTGCVLVVDSPSCAATQRLVRVGGSAQIEDEDPAYIDAEVDGVARRARFIPRLWRACGLAPGPHTVWLCTAAGPLTCSVAVGAAATAVLDIALVAPTVELRVDRVHRGALRAGQTLTVGLAGHSGPDHVQLAARGTFAWRTDDAQLRATPCDAPPSQPGCARCHAGGSPPWLSLGLVIALLVLRRHRR